LKVVKPILEAETIARMGSALAERGPRFALLWRLGIFTGLRISDLLRLRPRDFRGLRLSVIEQKSSKRKKIKFDRGFMSDIREYIRRHRLRPGDFLFYRNENQRSVPLSRQWARSVIASAAASLGLREIGAHSMRKIYACNIYRATGSIEAVRASLNHSKVETTLIYLRGVLGASSDVLGRK
jgi:integrase